MVSDRVLAVCEDLRNNSSEWKDNGYELVKGGVALWYQNTFLDINQPFNPIEKWLIRRAQVDCIANKAICEKEK